VGRNGSRPRWGYAIAPSDQTSIFYERWSDEATGGRVPVALCDGIGCSGYVWRYLRPALDGRTIVHAHYRGHGRSRAPRDPARVAIADLADDLIAVLDDAELPRAVAIGHSMGVQVALEAYHRHPDRIAGLVLVCGAPSNPLRTFRNAATLDERLPEIAAWIGRIPGVVNALARLAIPTRLAFEIAARLEVRRDLIEPSDFMPYLEGVARLDAQLFIRMLGEAGRHSAEEHLGDVAVPTLVIAAAHDGFTPPERSQKMAEAIPDAELVEVVNGSHTAPIERPELVNEAITDFLERRVDSPHRPPHAGTHGR
jgi:pimeloyl-ACP methyl ester carboxylesterase